MTSAPHTPVLLDEVVDAMSPRDGGVYVDGTFGAGGYSRALLDAADCAVFGIDRDPDAVRAGEAVATRYAGRLTLVQGRFGDMAALLARRDVARVDGVTLDLGVSSMQIDDAGRGFSFRFDGPLDMRMSGEGESAADVVNRAREEDLADLIYAYGEERHSRRIARAIVAARAEAPILRTLRLAEIVRRAIPVSHKKNAHAIDPATRTFQALRIHVNRELDELERGLAAAECLLSPGGRLAVVTFHSLEDRIVKVFLSERSGGRGGGDSRYMPEAPGRMRPPSFRVLTRKAVVASAGEVARNPRARSAKLRAAERTDAAPFAEAAA